ncbi:MAG: FecR domain-containing protein, partial [Ramlibacter sp.]|nr:FecR domain-containing protein [Ramlibacter sp.]
MPKAFLRALITPLLFLVLGWSGGALAADPPSRVARLAFVSGGASFAPGGERDWGRAIVNRPLITGDRLWVERGARAELQLGAAAIRVGASTSITLLNLNDRIAQVELAQGTLNIRVRRLDRGEIFEVATPHLAYLIRRPGSYRIHVDADGQSTTVTVRTGLAEVYGEGRAFVVRERQALRFFDSGLRNYQSFASWPVDDFDQWSNQRDRRWDTSPSRRYVSADMIGYEDLDQHGTWRQHREYGNVWVPSRVAADWAPYRDGHWSWVEPWGWTWIDEAPWGFAPSHYGRWAHIDGGWAWVPGPATVRPVYAPALVAFVPGSGLQSSGSGSSGGAVGWFPLGPRDVYRPSYTVSRQYFTNVNTSNTVITQVNVTNYYDNRNVGNVTYANQQVPGAVVAMLAAAFAQSRPVARETVRVNREMVARAPVAAVAPVAPVQASVVGQTVAPSAQPPERARSVQVVAQTAPPPPPVPFAAKQSALAANEGKPLDTAAVAALKPASAPSVPAVKVVPATQPVAAPAKPASAP